MTGRLWLVPNLACAGLLAGCFLPIGTAAPQSARTLGAGNWGGSFSMELPTLNLIAEDDSEAPDSPEELPIAPAAAMNFGVAYGVTDSLDLELNLEGAMLVFIVPIPLGVSAGLRANLIESESFDLAVAGRIGHIGLSSDVNSSGGSEGQDHADATYLAGSAVVQLGGTRSFRPGLALNIMPATVDMALDGQAPKSFRGLAASLTFMVELVTSRGSFSPFVAVTSFDSPDIDAARFVSGGVAVQLGGNRKRTPSTLYVVPPAPGPGAQPPPGPGAQPPPGPYAPPPPAPPPPAPSGPSERQPPPS